MGGPLSVVAAGSANHWRLCGFDAALFEVRVEIVVDVGKLFLQQLLNAIEGVELAVGVAIDGIAQTPQPFFQGAEPRRIVVCTHARSAQQGG